MADDCLEKVIHGGKGKGRQEKTHKQVLDFSASLNPFPPRISWNCNPEDLGRYPDDSYCELKEVIARSYNRDPAEVCVGNGSIELIRVFCSVVFRNKKDGKFFAASPTFGEYALSARLAGASTTKHESEADVHFVCNPNNPTGLLYSKETMLEFLAGTRSEALLFCDEAFIDLSDPRQSLSAIRDSRLFVLQSLTKSFAVPGLRFGFGFADPALAEKIEIARPPWSVNAYAEAFARAAIPHRKDVEQSRQLIEQERQWLTEELSVLGFSPCPSMANYVLFRYSMDVGPLCEKLAESDILVRDCSSFGLSDCIRVAVRTRDENRTLVEVIRSCVL